MGFADREYARRGSWRVPQLGAVRMWSVNTWLIAINVAVFIVDRLMGGVLFDWGYFSVQAAIHELQVWRFISFQFLHAGIDHIFFNLLALYFFGPMIEAYLGSRKYLAFYLLSGMGGGVMFFILWFLRMIPDGALIGASAGIFGVLIAAAQVAPDTTVMLIFPPIPMRLRVLALLMLGLALWVVLRNGPNAGGQAAHLGGAAVGALLIRYPRWLNVFQNWPPRRRRRKFFMDGFK